MSDVARSEAVGLPPGPRFPGFVQSAAWLFQPARFMEACRRRYGAVFTLRMAGLPPLVVLGDAESIRDVLTGDPEIFLAGEANRLLKPSTWLHSFGEASLFLLDARRHGDERKLMMSGFQPEQLLARQESLERVVDAWLDRTPIGRPLRLYGEMRGLSLDVLLDTYFGAGASQKNDQLSRAVARMLAFGEHSIPLVFAGRGAERRGRRFFDVAGRWSPWVALCDSIEDVNAALRREIAARRASPKDSRSDVLSLLVAACDAAGGSTGDDALLDEMRTLLVAGHETTARALTWAVLEVLRDERVHDRLRRECERDDEYLDAVIRETLRLHPIVPIVTRRLSAAQRVGGRSYPEGTVLAPSIHLAQLDPSAFRDPQRFDPERFIATKSGKFEFLPFGHGVRRCLGNAMALLEMRAVLRQMTTRPRFRLTPPALSASYGRTTFVVPADVEIVRDE